MSFKNAIACLKEIDYNVGMKSSITTLLKRDKKLQKAIACLNEIAYNVVTKAGQPRRKREDKMSKMKVAYMGKEHDLEIVVPGVVQKGNAYLIQCARTGEWCYCSLERMEKLKTKHGSIEAVGTGYLSRDARAAVKKEQLAKQAADEKAKKELAEKNSSATPPAASSTPPTPPGVTPAGSGKQKKS